VREGFGGMEEKARVGDAGNAEGDGA